jgi:hypothetical protein
VARNHPAAVMDPKLWHLVVSHQSPELFSFSLLDTGSANSLVLHVVSRMVASRFGRLILVLYCRPSGRLDVPMMTMITTAQDGSRIECGKLA